MKNYIIANWKMQLLDSEAVNLTSEIAEKYKANSNLELILCPSFTALNKVAEKIKNSQILLGAQNVCAELKGAFTGEISPLQLKENSVKYVILGHSERRQHFNEKDAEINAKVKTCLENDLTPVVCVGETIEKRQAGQTEITLMHQVSEALKDIKLNAEQKIIIAYEPVWVIGTGQAISPQEAEQASQVIQQTLIDSLGENKINQAIIIYGGSVDDQNIKSFLDLELISGALIGGASLSVDKFLPLINLIK